MTAKRWTALHFIGDTNGQERSKILQPRPSTLSSYFKGSYKIRLKEPSIRGSPGPREPKRGRRRIRDIRRIMHYLLGAYGWALVGVFAAWARSKVVI